MAIVWYKFYAKWCWNGRGMVQGPRRMTNDGIPEFFSQPDEMTRKISWYLDDLCFNTQHSSDLESCAEKILTISRATPHVVTLTFEWQNTWIHGYCGYFKLNFQWISGLSMCKHHWSGRVEQIAMESQPVTPTTWPLPSGQIGLSGVISFVKWCFRNIKIIDLCYNRLRNGAIRGFGISMGDRWHLEVWLWCTVCGVWNRTYGMEMCQFWMELNQLLSF